MITTRSLLAGSLLACVLIAGTAFAGVLDPECTPEKAVKGAAANATVGVGGRCKPAETVKDTVGIDDKNKKKDDGQGPAKKAAGKVKKD